MRIHEILDECVDYLAIEGVIGECCFLLILRDLLVRRGTRTVDQRSKLFGSEETSRSSFQVSRFGWVAKMSNSS